MLNTPPSRIDPQTAVTKFETGKKGNREMALIRGESIYASNIHEDTPENNDVSKW